MRLELVFRLLAIAGLNEMLSFIQDRRAESLQAKLFFIGVAHSG